MSESHYDANISFLIIDAIRMLYVKLNERGSDLNVKYLNSVYF